MALPGCSALETTAHHCRGFATSPGKLAIPCPCPSLPISIVLYVLPGPLVGLAFVLCSRISPWFKCLHSFLVRCSILRGFLKLCLAVLAWVLCGYKIADQVASLPGLALPLVFIFILEGAGDINIPRPPGSRTCFVEQREWKVCFGRLFSTSFARCRGHGGKSSTGLC